MDDSFIKAKLEPIPKETEHKLALTFFIPLKKVISYSLYNPIVGFIESKLP